MTSKTKTLLRLPVALAVVVLAGCTESSSPSMNDAAAIADAGSADATARDAGAPSDAGFDAGCLPGQPFDPITMMCEPLG